MKARHPDVVMNVDRLLIEHSDVMTAGGMMAWVDLSMALIERFIGRDAMIETARRFIVDLGRLDQRRFRRFAPNLSHKDAAIRKAQLAIESGFRMRLSVTDLANQAGLAERTFVRRFTTVTGLSPMAYVQSIRIEQAKDLLIHSKTPIQTVAFETGYSDPSAFGRKFHQFTGMTPKDFRQKFSA